MDYGEIFGKQLDQVIDEQEIAEIERKTSQLTEGLSDQFSLQHIADAAVDGHPFFDTNQLIDSLKSLLLYEVETALILAVEVLSVCIVMGFLRSLSDSFKTKSVSELSMMICTMVIIGIAMNSFRLSYELTLDTVNTMVYTMGILMPVLIGILIATGAAVSGTVLSPVLIGAVTGFGVLIKTVIMPALFISTVLSLINCLTEKNYVNKLAKLIRTAAVVTTGLLLTLLTGIITLQGLLTEASDGLLINATKYSLSTFIPIVGGFTSDTVELFLRCMGSIKSVVGVFGVIALLLLMLVPLLKLLIITGIYKLMGALSEPISDGKIADGLSDMGSSLASICAILFFTCLLFILFISTIIRIGGTA